MPDVGVTKEKRENKTSASSSIDDIMASVMSKPKEKDENKTSAGSIADIMASVKSEPKSEIKENKTSSIAD
ncbi:MAG: hypothetical protein IJ736_01990, partial [Firmicutes bacterium]|nr:hypothetical protein [Bacillota bacterium]